MHSRRLAPDAEPVVARFSLPAARTSPSTVVAASNRRRASCPEAILEDVAGNNLAQVFDVDPSAEGQRTSARDVVVLRFVVGP